MSALPNFLIIGAGKSGTTSLWNYLNQHPQVGMSAIKEPSFFSMDDVYARGLNWYERLFAGLEGSIARGEASNSYSATETFPKTIDRIAETLRAPRFVYIVRHPRERTESDWMERVKGEPIDFSDFLRKDLHYADKNNYIRNYSRYANRFGSDRILVLFYQDLKIDPKSLLRVVSEFLGINPEFEYDTEVRHGQSVEHRAFLPGLGTMRRSKLYADLSLRLPRGVKSAARHVLSRPRQVERPVWTDADREWFSEHYQAPSRAFLEMMGRSPDEWAW